MSKQKNDSLNCIDVDDVDSDIFHALDERGWIIVNNLDSNDYVYIDDANIIDALTEVLDTLGYDLFLDGISTTPVSIDCMMDDCITNDDVYLKLNELHDWIILKRDNEDSLFINEETLTRTLIKAVNAFGYTIYLEEDYRD